MDARRVAKLALANADTTTNLRGLVILGRVAAAGFPPGVTLSVYLVSLSVSRLFCAGLMAGPSVVYCYHWHYVGILVVKSS